MKVYCINALSLIIVGSLRCVVIAQDVDGGWTDWEDASACCGGMKQVVRTCTNPTTQGNGTHCVGPNSFSETCGTDDCGGPVGGWLEWVDSSLCCNGQKTMIRECTWDIPCTGADTQVVSCTRDDIGCVMPSVDGGWSDWQAEGSCCNGSQTYRRTCTNPIQSGNGADCVGSETEIQSCEIESDNCPSDADEGADSSTTDETSGVDSEIEETNEDSGNTETNEGTATQNIENIDSITASDPISDSGNGDEPVGDTESVEDTTNENGIGNTEDSTPVDETSESSNGSSSAGSQPTSSVENIDGGWSQWRNASLCCNGIQEFVRTCDSPSRSGMGEPCKGKATEQLNCYPDTCIPEDIDGGWSEWQAESKCCNGVRILSRSCTNPIPSGKGSLCLGQAREAEACYTNDCDDVAEGDWLPWEDETKCCNGIKTVSRSCKFGSVCTGPVLSTQNCYPDTCSEAASEKLDGWSSWTPVGFCCLGKQPYTRTCDAPELGCEGTQRDDRPCTFGEICAAGVGSDSTSMISQRFPFLLAFSFAAALML